MASDAAASTSTAADGRAGSPGAQPEEASHHLQVLGLGNGATWDDICAAHARLVADLTPGPDASHRNVALARDLLDEVNTAFSSLRLSSVA
jgi:hypothetical protein